LRLRFLVSQAVAAVVATAAVVVVLVGMLLALAISAHFRQRFQ
jgi:hypothetical protein